MTGFRFDFLHLDIMVDPLGGNKRLFEVAVSLMSAYGGYGGRSEQTYIARED